VNRVARTTSVDAITSSSGGGERGGEEEGDSDPHPPLPHLSMSFDRASVGGLASSLDGVNSNNNSHYNIDNITAKEIIFVGKGNPQPSKFVIVCTSLLISSYLSSITSGKKEGSNFFFL
jgi:hypothetical protein